MTPTELALKNPPSLCWSEFGVVLDAEDLALSTERANGEASAAVDCLDGVTDVSERAGGYESSRLAKSSSSKKSEEHGNIYSLFTVYKSHHGNVLHNKHDINNELNDCWNPV